MDVCESEKQSTVETTRPPLVPADNKNETFRRSRTREVSSRYRSPSPQVAADQRQRCPSPNAGRTSSNSTPSTPKRAISAERKRPSRPSSPTPSTPIQDTRAETLLASRKIAGKDSLWPSTMRSLSASFQSDSVSVPVNKKEKPVSHTLSDRTLKPSSNVSRKPTPERKRTPLKGKDPTDQFENSKPIDGSHTRLVDQNRWPSRTTGKVSSSALNRSVNLTDKERKSSNLRSSTLNRSVDLTDKEWKSSNLRSSALNRSVDLTGKEWKSSNLRSSALNRSVDLTDKERKSSNLRFLGTTTPSLRRLSLDGASGPSQKSASDLLMEIARDDSSARLKKAGSSISSDRSVDLIDKERKSSTLRFLGASTPSLRRLSLDGASRPSQKSASDLLMEIARDDNSARLKRAGASVSSDKATLLNAAARALSLPTPSSRPSSPAVSRGVSPSRAKNIKPSSRGPSPSRVRPSSPSRQPESSTSVLSFIADIKKGKKAASHIEDIHELRMLYNRHLQWRYANARADAALHSQKAKAEIILYSVWTTIMDIWDSVIQKRIELQQLKIMLTLHSVLNDQLTCLDEWTSIERDHTNSLTQAIHDLQASTIRIPITGGARGDIETVKAAICSAVDVMQTMGSSLSSILSQVEAMNSLVSQLAGLAAHERGMLDECELLLGSAAALQVEENSLRTHLFQIKQAYGEPLSRFSY